MDAGEVEWSFDILTDVGGKGNFGMGCHVVAAVDEPWDDD